MKIYTFKLPIRQIFVFESSLLVATSKKHYSNDKKPQHYIIKNNEAIPQTKLNSGKLRYYFGHPERTYWYSRSQPDINYLDKEGNLAATTESHPSGLDNSFPRFKSKEYFALNSRNGINLDKTVDKFIMALIGAKKDETVTIFLKDSTQEVKVMKWEKPFDNFAISADELTFFGYYENELMVIDNPFM